MIELTATNNPFDSLIKFIDRLAKPTTTDTRPVADAISAGILENFVNERNGNGAAWPPLSPFTVQDRIAHGFGGDHPILVRTGQGRDSFASGADHLERLEITGDGWRLDVGSTNEKMIKNALGDGRVPARPMNELSNSAQSAVTDAITAMVKNIQASVLHGQ